jgi:glycerophosphoryl diester phosphodiesterase
VTGFNGKVSELTLEEIKSKPLIGTTDTVPTLHEVLELIDGAIPLLFEIKEEGMDHTLSEKVAEILKDYKGDFLVESFSPLAFGAIRAELPGTACGFLSDKLTENGYRSLKYRLIQRFLLNVVARPSFIAMNLKRSRMFPLPFIKKIFGTVTFAWTVRSEKEEAEAYENGFSGIIFENYLPESVSDGGNL